MSSRVFPIIIVVGVLLLIAATSLFTVSEAQLAIRTEFGAIVTSQYSPGLHVKWPWDQVVTFDKRMLSQTYSGETFLTNDNRGLIVDFYIKWRVKNPSEYFQATGGSEDVAIRRLSEIVKDGIKTVVAERTLEKIVSAERAAVTAGCRVPAIGLQFDFAVAARPGELVEQRSWQRQVEKIGPAVNAMLRV